MSDDKAFNKLPMIVVCADSLDPRSQRQLKSQLQATVMSLGEVDAELKNQEAAKEVKDQLDSVKDNTEFDDEDVKDKADPNAIENNKPEEGAQDGQSEQNNSDRATQPETNSNGDAGANGDPFGGDSKQDPANPTESAQPNPPAGGQEEGGDQSQSQGSADNGANPQANQASRQAPQETNAGDAFSDGAEGNGAGSPPNAPQAGQPQQPSTPPQQQTTQAPAVSNGDSGEDPNDPFSDKSPTFEAFAGILGLEYKTEDASKQTEAEMPPFKMFILVKGSDQGVDQRTSAVIATIQDPQNAVVVIDLGDVVETEAKMQFSAVKKQLQGRGVTVMDTIDEAIEYLNEVYEQVSGGGSGD